MIDRSKAPALHPIRLLTLPHIESQTLANGARLHSYGGGDQPIITLCILFSGGHAECANPSLQSIYTQTLFEGTAHLSAVEVAEILDYQGVRLSPLRFDHYTGFRVSMLKRHAQSVIALLREVLAEPLFGDREVSAAKTASLARLRLLNRQMNNIADETLRPMVFGQHHPLARKPDEFQIEQITCSDLHAYHRSLIASAGAHAFLSGPFTPEIETSVEELLQSIPSDIVPIAQHIIPYTPGIPERRDIHRDYAEQSAIAMAMPAIMRSHADYHNLRLAVMALGGYFGSRLMSNIREEKGLTYGIEGVLSGRIEGSEVHIEAQCSHEYVDTVIAEVGREMQLLVSNPPQGEELERLRRHCYTDTLMILDTPTSISSYCISALTLGMPADYFENQQRAIADLESSIIADMAAKYLDPKQLRIAVAGK